MLTLLVLLLATFAVSDSASACSTSRYPYGYPYGVINPDYTPSNFTQMTILARAEKSQQLLSKFGREIGSRARDGYCELDTFIERGSDADYPDAVVRNVTSILKQRGFRTFINATTLYPRSFLSMDIFNCTFAWC